MSTDLNALLNGQRDIHSRIARSVENLKKMGMGNITRWVIETRIKLLDQLWAKFESQHDLIVASYKERYSESEYAKTDFYDVAENTYVQQRSVLEEHASHYEVSAQRGAMRSAASQDQHSDSAPKTSLPRIRLPPFSGAYEEWPSFRDLFLSVVGENPSISNVERFHYLRSCVQGAAERLIKSLTLTSENYDRAWTILSQHFENKKELIRSNFATFTAVAKMKGDTVDELDRVYHAVTAAVNAQESIGRPIDTHGMDLFNFMVVELFDPRTRLEWETSIGDSLDPPTHATLLSFISKRALALKAAKPKPLTKPPMDTPRTAKAHFAGRGTDTTLCALCKAKHHIMTCSQFKGKSAGERKAVAEAHKLCYNCLGNHQMARCQSTKNYLTCKARHHTLLHDAYAHTQVTEASALTAGRQISDQKATLLATARVDVADRHGEPHSVRALIDQGSEVSIVSESLVQRLHLRRSHSSTAIYGIGGARSGSANGKVIMSVSSRVTGAELQIVAFVLPHLSVYTGSGSRSGPRWPHLKGLSLADPQYHSSDPVELLLGAEVCSIIFEADIRRGGEQAPLAQKTSLGWILFGGRGTALKDHCSSLQCFADHDLTELVHRFWEQEKEPASFPSLTPEDQQCEDIFAKTHSRMESGRYMVRLPFSASPPDLPETRKPAERLLMAMERKSHQDPHFGQLYRAFMLEYEDLGHMEPVSCTEDYGIQRCYLPHHGVLRNTGTISKLRVVFNGSQRTRTGESINSTLLVGENLLPKLPGVLMRWRWHRYAFITDIEKMYRQVLVHPDDRDHQRVLWRDSLTAAVREFRLCTVTYGLACAPFLAIRTLRQLAADEKERFPRGAAALRDDCYVDDVVTGAHSLTDTIAIQRDLRELCTAGGFPLRKWAANDSRVLSGVPPEHCQQTPHQWSDPGHCTLGLRWDPRTDTFAFTINPRTHTVLTKRLVLAESARLFDPLGWLAPVTVRAKIMLQSAWLKHFDWDTPLPGTDAGDWERFLGELPLLTKLRVNRWLNSTKESSVQLHGFADASERAYAAAVYLRVTQGGTTRVSLLSAKSKVAPVKPVSLPRLELCATALLTSLTCHIRTLIDVSAGPVYLWTDPKVTLHWIQGHASRWKTYVANRVSRIQQELPEAQWRHVPGRDNPADCASRGIAPGDLKDHPLWWTGPAWLTSHPHSWPDERPEAPTSDVPEQRVTSLMTTTNADEEPELLRRFSSLARLLRTTAWCLRWRHLARSRSLTKSSATPSLDPEEVDNALLVWIRKVQRMHYGLEAASLLNGRDIPARSTLIRLGPFMDDNKVMRVGGRLKHSPLPHDERHPIIIPPTSWLTQLIVDAHHKKTLHGGVQLTLGTLRLRYWLPRGRAVVKQRLHNCASCTRWRAVSPHPQMSNLPRARVTPARPFHHTGVDYAGPIMLRTSKGRGHRAHKAFIAVFVCLSTRAVHIEVVSDYTAEAFLAAFKRFTARRGLCREMYSDSGTNFVGADRLLRQMFRASSADGRRIAHAVSTEGIRWHFNPPSAPHFGGLWEAAVKSVKHHLRRVIGQATLTFEEMTTLLAQVEACLNSRPLHAMTDDPDDLTALTPGHFLIGAPLLAVPEPAQSQRAESTSSRWKLLQGMRDHFWDRWSSEYIHGLASRPKWHRRQKAPEIGSLCLVRSETTPPNQWPLARITQLHPGDDGVIRVVTVRTASSELVRPLIKIVLLPSTGEAEHSM